MYSVKYPGSGIETKPGMLLGTRAFGEEVTAEDQSPWGRVTLTPPGLHRGCEMHCTSSISECRNTAKGAPLRSDSLCLALLLGLLLFLMQSKYSNTACLIWCEGMQNSGSKWTSFLFMVMCITCMLLDFFYFFFKPKTKASHFSTLFTRLFSHLGVAFCRVPI